MFNLFYELCRDVKLVLSSRNTRVILPIILVLTLLHSLLIWAGLKVDFVIGMALGNQCFQTPSNIKILVAIFSIFFFVIATLYGVGETVNLLDGRVRSRRQVVQQKRAAIAALTSAVFIAIGSGLYVASWC